MYKLLLIYAEYIGGSPLEEMICGRLYIMDDIILLEKPSKPSFAIVSTIRIIIANDAPECMPAEGI